MNQSKPVHDFLMAAFRKAGLAVPSSGVCTCLLQEGRLVAQKFRYDAGYAIWLLARDVVDFYDREGTLLKSVCTATAENKAA